MATFNPTTGAPVVSLGASHGLSENVKNLMVFIPVTTALALADILNIGYLPAGARVVGARIMNSTPLDTNGAPTLTLDVGDAGSATRLFSASTGGYAATGDGNVLYTALNYQYTAPTLIYATVHAAGATKAAGSVVVKIEYVIEPLAS